MFYFTKDYVVDLLIQSIREHILDEGILISGFPRNVEQIHRFEKKVYFVIFSILLIKSFMLSNQGRDINYDIDFFTQHHLGWRTTYSSTY